MFDHTHSPPSARRSALGALGAVLALSVCLAGCSSPTPAQESLDDLKNTFPVESRSITLQDIEQLGQSICSRSKKTSIVQESGRAMFSMWLDGHDAEFAGVMVGLSVRAFCKDRALAERFEFGR